jgi:hypothetical protein
MYDAVHLYTHPKTEPPIADCDAFWKRFPSLDGNQERQEQWTPDVRIDGSPEGFFELAMLRAAGAGYWSLDRFVCSLEDGEQLLRARACANVNIRDGAPGLDLVPRVDLTGHMAAVHVALLAWGCTEDVSLQLATLSVEREPPYATYTSARITPFEGRCVGSSKKE